MKLIMSLNVRNISAVLELDPDGPYPNRSTGCVYGDAQPDNSQETEGSRASDVCNSTW